MQSQPQQMGYPQQQVLYTPLQQGYPQQAAHIQQPGQTIVIQSPPRSNVYENYPAQASLAFGGTQLTIGIFLVILNIAALCVDAYIAFIGHGIWCGVFFIITGSFGITAGKNRTLCPIITFMVLSILSALMSFNVLAFSGIGLSCDSRRDCRGYSYDYHDYGDYDDYDINGWPESEDKDARVAVNGAMVLLGGIECIVAIISSALCCAGICGGRNYSSSGAVISTGGNTQYITTQPGQSVQIQGAAVPMNYAPAGVPAGAEAPPPLSSPNAPPAYGAAYEKPRI